MSGNAFINYRPDRVLSSVRDIKPGIGNFDIQLLQGSITPTIDLTHVINLPLVEQNAPATTPIPPSNEEILILAGSKGTETPTPTATIFPQQTTAANLSIVVGAMVILGIIVLAGLIFGRLLVYASAPKQK
jgi:hypothetical protein